MKSEARLFVNDAMISIEEFKDLEQIDSSEPWHWHETRSTFLKQKDDNGADFTAVFNDGSEARWDNANREWYVIKEG